jgi:hypothetical protein
MVTIGFDGFDAESFVRRLRHADVRLLLDVRQRWVLNDQVAEP